MPQPLNRERKLSSFLDDNDVPDPSIPTSSLSSPKNPAANRNTQRRQSSADIQRSAISKLAALSTASSPRSSRAVSRGSSGSSNNPSPPVLHVGRRASMMSPTTLSPSTPSADRRRSVDGFLHPARAAHWNRLEEKSTLYQRRTSYGKQVQADLHADCHYVRFKSTMVPISDLKYLKAYFDQLDLDKSGDLDFSELEKAMQKTEEFPVTSPKVGVGLKAKGEDKDAQKDSMAHWGFQGGGSQILQKLRANADQFDTHIRFEDVLQLVYPGIDTKTVRQMVEAVSVKKEEEEKPPQVSEEKQRDFDGIWALWDYDGSGELNEDELREALRMLGVEEQEDFDEFYAELDEDGNGSISKEEFQEWWFKQGDESDGESGDGKLDAENTEVWR